MFFFVDFDKEALEIAKMNISKVKSEDYKLGKIDIIHRDVEKLDIKVDAVFQNPPFGTKERHKDSLFLKKALEVAPVVYSFHKSETKAFLHKLSKENNATITHVWNFKFPLKVAFDFHRRRIHRIDVSCFRFETSKL